MSEVTPPYFFTYVDIKTTPFLDFEPNEVRGYDEGWPHHIALTPPISVENQEILEGVMDRMAQRLKVGGFVVYIAQIEKFDQNGEEYTARAVADPEKWLLVLRERILTTFSGTPYEKLAQAVIADKIYKPHVAVGEKDPGEGLVVINGVDVGVGTLGGDKTRLKSVRRISLRDF